jgi:hypothetical protein
MRNLTTPNAILIAGISIIIASGAVAYRLALGGLMLPANRQVEITQAGIDGLVVFVRKIRSLIYISAALMALILGWNQTVKTVDGGLL